MDVTERRTALRKQFDFPEHAEGSDVWNYMCALEERVLATEATIEELLQRQEKRRGRLSDTLQQLAEAETRIAELTADEEPRKAAERIANEFVFGPCTRPQLIDAITTAIQAAVEAQLERGREHEDALNKARRREADNYSRILADHEKQIEEWRKQNNGLKSTLRAKIAELESKLEFQLGEIDGLKHTAQVSVEDAYANRHTQHVREFMEKFGQYIGSYCSDINGPGWPPQEVLDLRIKLGAEEFCEKLMAAGYCFELRIGMRGGQLWFPERGEPILFSESVATGWLPDFPEFVDACIDSEYVNLGDMIACGVDPQPIWEAVHASNMAKQPAADKFSKITKPDGWQAPDIAGALREQGWGGAE